MVARRALVADLLERRPWCEVRWDGGCEGRAVDVDEIVGRGVGGSFLDESNCQTTCRHCHRMKTENPGEAQRRGLTVQRRQCATDRDDCTDDTPCISCPWRAA
jgi:hypothetical protein